MNIAVIGTDEIGLSTAILLAYLNNFVVLVDDNQTKVDLLKNNSLAFYEPNLNEALKLISSNLYFTTNLTNAIEMAEVVYFTTSNAASGYSSSEVCQIFNESLKDKRKILINKSINNLGLTKNMDKIIRSKSNNFSIMFEVPYVNNGNIITNTFYPEKVVIGADDSVSVEIIKKLYEPLINKGIVLPTFIQKPHGPDTAIIWTTIESAEMVLHSERVFNGLKTSFINEINNIAQQYDAKIDEVLKIMKISGINNLNVKYGLGWSKKEYGDNFSILTEAADKSKLEIPLIKNALVSNYAQRDILVNKISNSLKGLSGKKIGILGLSYKPFSDDITDSPAIDIMNVLNEHGAHVYAHDPIVNFKFQHKFPDLAKYCDSVMDIFDDADMIVLITEWPEYLDLDWFQLSKTMRNRVVFDARNILAIEEFESMGFKLLSFGT